MNWHRFLCAIGCHWWAHLGNRWRGCAVCTQQQRWIEDAHTGAHGFWLNMVPKGKICDE